MPSPGGGSRSGGYGMGSRGGGAGGSRGGSHGGGYGMGSRGGMGGGPRGPMHHGPMHYGPRWYRPRPIFVFGPRYHRPYGHGPNNQEPNNQNGGCLASPAVSVIIVVVLTLMLLVTAASVFNPNRDTNANIIYDETRFQDYAYAKYDEIFAGNGDYEKNILLVYSIYEGFDGAESFSLVGDKIPTYINLMFTSEAIAQHISDNYKRQFAKGVAMSIETLTDQIPQIENNTDTSYSKVYNDTEFDFSEEVINESLVAFTEKTGYTIVVVVEDGKDIFETQMDLTQIVGVIFIVILGVMIFMIISTTISNVRYNKKYGNPNNTNKTDPNAGQGRYDPNSGTWK